MSDYMPEEVLIDIFLRLPIKSIVRFTCVCKSWYSLLTTPSFISTHLKQNQDDHILVKYCPNTPRKEIYSLFYDNENLDQYAQFDLPFEPCNCYFRVVGSCNGLLCLSDDASCYYNHIYLWNPSIRKSVKLPKPIVTFETHGPFGHTVGFGYDPVTNDYKVVRVVSLECARMRPKVELYKLSTGVWEDISHVAPFYYFREKEPQVHFNGASHWLASKCNALSKDMIALFDMHDETFREMMLPGNEFFRGVLYVSDESLYLLHSSSSPEKLDIWIMKEYGEPESWVKQFSITSFNIKSNSALADDIYFMIVDGSIVWRLIYKLKNTMAIRKNGEIIWRANNGLLVSYDHAAVEKIKELGVFNTTEDQYYSLYVNTFKESLVLLDRQTDYCDRETSEQSSDLCKRKPKVREPKTDVGRGGGRGVGRGYSRGRSGGGFNREASNNENLSRNIEFSDGIATSEDGDGGKPSERRGGYVPRPSRGGRRGGFSNGEVAEGDRPRRVYVCRTTSNARSPLGSRSGTGRGYDVKCEGAGRENWGTQADDVKEVTEEVVNEGEENLNG